MNADDTNTDIGGARQLTGLTTRRIWLLVKEHKIPHVRFGPRTVRFPVAELRAWVDARRVRAA